MKKGFTLVEMLAVVLILGVILLIGIPIYQGIQTSTSESIYDSKISNVKSKAEVYSEEHGIFIYDVRKMISLGLLTPDNEAGEYKDPRDNRDMRCDIIQVFLEDNQYYASISTGYNNDGTIHCYTDEELQNMNSLVRIKFYKDTESEEEYPQGWIKANHVYAGYEFVGVPDVSNVTATWGEIGTPLDNGMLDIYSERILNTLVQLHIEFDYSGKHIAQDVTRNIRIDNEPPVAYIKEGPGSERTPSLAKVTWELSDNDGSGVSGHIILDEESFRSKPCESYTPSEIPDSDKTTVSKHLDNGVYYMCVKDYVGNITRNSDAYDNRVVVNNVDQSGSTIRDFKVESRTNPYKLMDVSIKTTLDDANTNGYEMCVSHTGYLDNCSWEPFNSSKDYTISGYDYGSEVLFYISVKDSVGNISNRETSYTIDNLQYLDLNGQLNGTNQANITNIGTCDIYINGSLSKTGVSDFYEKQVPGSTYEIKNCKANTGYRYKGNASFTGTIGRTSSSVVYAPYVNLYTISYNMNGGSGSVNSQTKEHGTNINLATVSSTKAGYTYGGWNTNAAGTGTNYNAGASYSGNGSVTLYAKWNPNTITTTLDNQSATSAGTTKVYYKYNINKYYSNSGTTAAITNIVKPAKNGYTFDGYFTGTNGSGTKYINNAGVFVNDLYKVVNNKTLYAKWKANTINITLDRQSGSGGTGNIYYAYNSNAYFSNNTLATTLSGKITPPSRTGHTFKGYYSAKNGGGTQYVNAGGSIVNNLYKAYTSNATIYAYWTVNKYYLDLNGLLDGKSSGNISGYGTADVYINNSLVCDDCADYYTQWNYGTSYEIKDIKAASGFAYQGVSSGAIKGTIGAGNVSVQLKFATAYKTPATLKVGDVIYYTLPASKGGNRIKAIVMEVSGGTAKVIPETAVETYNTKSQNIWTVTSDVLNRCKAYLNTSMATDVQTIGSGQGNDPKYVTSKEDHDYVGKRSLVDSQVSMLNNLRNKGFNNFYLPTYYASCRERENKSCSGRYTLVKDNNKITDAGFMIYFGDDWESYGSSENSTSHASIGIGSLSGWTTITVKYEGSSSSLGYYEVQSALIPIITLKSNLQFKTGNGSLANPYSI